MGSLTVIHNWYNLEVKKIWQLSADCNFMTVIYVLNITACVTDSRLKFFFLIFTMAEKPPRAKAYFYQGFTITLRHNTLDRTPLDEWSDRRRDLYLTTHNIHDRQTPMPPRNSMPHSQ